MLLDEAVESGEDMGGDGEVLLFGAASDSDGADDLTVDYEGNPAGHYCDAWIASVYAHEIGTVGHAWEEVGSGCAGYGGGVCLVGNECCAKHEGVAEALEQTWHAVGIGNGETYVKAHFAAFVAGCVAKNSAGFIGEMID